MDFIQGERNALILKSKTLQNVRGSAGHNTHDLKSLTMQRNRKTEAS